MNEIELQKAWLTGRRVLEIFSFQCDEKKIWREIPSVYLFVSFVAVTFDKKDSQEKQ